MLKAPYAGWTTIKIGDWSDRASYLTDVPMDILDAFINSYNYWQPAVIKFDAEGWEYTVVIDDYETYIIDYLHNDEGDYLDSFEANPTLTIIKVKKKNLAKEVLNDIKSNFNSWVEWCSDDGDPEEIKKYEYILHNKVQKLEKTIIKDKI